ncbi:MAG: NosD domain-containing protein, partial [Promethearchaeota archaeon]
FSNDNVITKNTINNNRRGIWLSYNCNNNIISRNKLFGNDECIIEENSIGNIIENNNCDNESILGYYPFLIINGVIVITIILGKKLKKNN